MRVGAGVSVSLGTRVLVEVAVRVGVVVAAAACVSAARAVRVEIVDSDGGGMIDAKPKQAQQKIMTEPRITTNLPPVLDFHSFWMYCITRPRFYSLNVL